MTAANEIMNADHAPKVPRRRIHPGVIVTGTNRANDGIGTNMTGRKMFIDLQCAMQLKGKSLRWLVAAIAGIAAVVADQLNREGHPKLKGAGRGSLTKAVAEIGMAITTRAQVEPVRGMAKPM
jgi:hypothetical protein